MSFFGNLHCYNAADHQGRYVLADGQGLSQKYSVSPVQKFILIIQQFSFFLHLKYFK